MPRRDFIFNGKYYNYKDTDLYPNLNEDIPSELIDVYSERANAIKSLQICSKLMRKKSDNSKELLLLTNESYKWLKVINDAEQQIIDYKKLHNLSYSNDFSCPIDEKYAPSIEEQDMYICTNCDSVYDLYSNLKRNSSNNPICLKCGNSIVTINNIYCYEAEKYENTALKLIDQNKFDESITARFDIVNIT